MNAVEQAPGCSSKQGRLLHKRRMKKTQINLCLIIYKKEEEERRKALCVLLNLPGEANCTKQREAEGWRAQMHHAARQDCIHSTLKQKCDTKIMQVIVCKKNKAEFCDLANQCKIDDTYYAALFCFYIPTLLPHQGGMRGSPLLIITTTLWGRIG